jgi:hypothetical protein
MLSVPGTWKFKSVSDTTFPFMKEALCVKKCAAFPLCKTAIWKGVRWCSWLGNCATRWEVRGSIPGRVLGNVQVTSSFCPHSIALGSTQPLLACKVRPAPRPDESAVLVVQNVKVRVEAQHSILPPPPPLGLLDLLRGKLYIYLLLHENVT